MPPTILPCRRGRLAARRAPVLLTLASVALLPALLVAATDAPGELSREDLKPPPAVSSGDSGPTLEALRVEQVTSGLPDARSGQSTRSERQTLTVAQSGDRLVLDQLAASEAGATPRLESRHILRLDRDPPVIWDLLADGTAYREFEGNLNRSQRDRDIYENQLLRNVRRLSSKERRKILEDHHLQSNGRRDVVVTWEAPGQILGKPCKHLVVTENGRRIIDAYISEEVAGGRTFFDLYRRLGAFSSQVLDKIKDIKGLPLKAAITVVTKLPAYKLDVEVKKIETVRVAASFFELPRSARRVVETPQVLRCRHCGKPVDKGVALRWRRPGEGLLHFCDARCKKAYARKVLRNLPDRTKK